MKETNHHKFLNLFCLYQYYFIHKHKSYLFIKDINQLH